MSETIKIGGEIESTATGNKVADVANIKDKTKGNKSQAQINAELETALEERYTKSETYNKTQLDNMITTPNQEYVTVTATDQTTDVTDVLPATGEADTVYRVGNWDGSQQDPSVYSEYAWNGSQYVHLSTKTKIGEVFDISAYHATGGELAKYADLAAALDSNNGGGVPQSLQKGGMSIKFVRSSDNKYVQYRLMTTSFSTTVSDWQGVDDEPVAGSKNLVESEGVLKNILNRICPIVGFGSWQSIDKNDWKVGDIYVQYVTDHLEIGIVKSITSTSTGTKPQSLYPSIIPSDNKTILFLLNGEFYVVNEAGDDIVRQKDIVGLLAKIGNLENLDTEAKTDAVSAINELVSAIEALNNSFYYNEVQEKRENKYWRTNNAVVGESWDGNSTNLDGAYSSVKLDVNSGDVYYFYGIGSNSAQSKTYVITDSNNIILAISNTPTATDYRTTPLKITIPEGGKNLYVNFGLASYTSTDKLTKLVKYDFAESIADITSNIGDLSNLTTEDKSNLVAAINELVAECVKIGDLSELKTTDKTSLVDAINEIADNFIVEKSTDIGIRTGKYWGTGNAVVGESWTGNSKGVAGYYSSEKVTVSAGELYKFYGIANNANAFKTYVITDSADLVLVISNLSSGTDYRTTPLDIVIPENGANLYVNFNTYDSTTDKLVKYSKKDIDLAQLSEDVEECKSDIEELKKLPWYGKTIVCFGDSMTEFSISTKKRYSDYLADISGANVINVGIGGTRLAQRATPSLTPESRLQAIAALDICNLVKASVEQDFSLQDAAMAYLESISDPIAEKIDIINRLKSIDWSVVDIVTVCGGANDWMSDVNLGEEDSANLGEALGGLNYIVQSLTYTYPKVRVFYFAQIMLGTDANLRSGASNAFNKNHAYIVDDDVFYDSKLWRFTANHQGDWSDNDARRITQAELQAMGSDVVTNANGLTFKQYTRALIECSTNNHIPTCDMYMTMWNINQLPSVMHADFHHPLNGMEQIAEKFYGFISANRNFDM